MSDLPVCARLQDAAPPSLAARDALFIASRAISAALPENAVARALNGRAFSKPVTLIAVGKAAWRMAKAAQDALGGAIKRGVVVTKRGHSRGAIGGMEILEAGHPVPDGDSFRAGARVTDIARGLTENDECLLLLSGGGSSLMECAAAGVTAADIADITDRLLRCAADIEEINCVRKRLSALKGGRLAELIAPARIFAVVLSDVVGDRLDAIASGVVSPDLTTCDGARAVIQKYRLSLSPGARAALERETPKAPDNVEYVIAGGVQSLCAAAADAARARGYQTEIVDDAVACEAREAGRKIAALAKTRTPPFALVFGGETVVRVVGTGRGGRNQEVALAAAEGIAGMDDACVLAVGSDGTDGPTDAAGGLVTGAFYARVGAESIGRHLVNNNAYPLLKSGGGLVMTGATGTNVNDLYLLLVR